MGDLNRETEKPSLEFLLIGGELRAGTPCAPRIQFWIWAKTERCVGPQDRNLKEQFTFCTDKQNSNLNQKVISRVLKGLISHN